MNDIQTHDAIAEGLEQTCSLITRYAMVEGLYLHINLPSEEQLIDSLVCLYAAILDFLSRAIRYYSRNTGGSTSTSTRLLEKLIIYRRTYCEKYSSEYRNERGQLPPKNITRGD